MDAEINIQAILEIHKKWLNGDGGERADLRGANLRGADLRDADLRDADLSDADLRGANLRDADLSDAYLRGANLRGADLSGADLRDADLRGANLRDADLSDADLRGANLSDADLRDADLRDANLRGADLSGANSAKLAIAMASHLPEGDLIGWKMCQVNVIVKLLIPSNAKRSHGASRKCRAEFAKVLEIFGAEEARSIHDDSFVYRVGETVRPHSWNDDRWDECSGGIHFFITRIEAENYR